MTKAERLEAEIKRTELMKEFDREYKIYGTICGIDEAGRGPLWWLLQLFCRMSTIFYT